MSAHSWFNRVWYGQADPPAWLKPAAWLYGAIVRLRRLGYARRWLQSTALSRPVIVVGNLTVGGTGKTPLVCWLVSALAQRGYQPGIVSRGYGGSAHATHRVQPSDRAEIVGDEPLLLARRTGLPVAVGRRRPAAAQMLIEAGCDVIISDDGLQHYALQRQAELVVVDGERGFGNGWLLPAGPLREARERLAAVTVIVANGGDADMQALPREIPLIVMRLEGQEALSLAGGVRRALRDFAGGPVHALAGIGNPQRFFDLLTAQGLTVLPHPLPDHAPLAAKDIRFDDAYPVLMTEKDAVKCSSFAGPAHWYVPVSAAFAPGAGERLLDSLVRAING
jgi:tetraacyldisaccharide 4'-kinase